MNGSSVTRTYALVLVAGLGLGACGGGGGGGGGTTPPPSGSVTVSGSITFDRPSYAANNTLSFTNLERKPIRGATVEILRASDQSVLASTASSASGSYSATVANTPIVVRVKAQLQRAGAGGYDFEVRNNTSGNALYSLASGTVTPSGSTVRVDLNAPTGWGGTSYTGARAAAPFAILDTLWEATEVLQAAEPGLTMPALELYWSSLNSAAECVDGQPDPTSGAIGTTFYVNGTIDASANCPSTPPGIYVLGDANGTFNDDADEFDSSVIAHELGHYFQDAFSRDDSMGGPHFLDAYHDPALSFSEGWGNAFQGFVLDDNWYRDTFGASGNFAFAFDMENNTAPYTVLNGFYAEASIHEFLWDVYDGAGDDSISLGYGAIHEVMRNEIVATDALTSVFSFSSALETRNATQQAAIRSRLASEGIVGVGDFAAGQTLPGDTDLVPVFVPVTFGVPVTITSTSRFADPEDDVYQAYNRLGSHRFLKIDLPTGGGLRISAQGPPGSDPDFQLLKDGIDQCGGAPACSGFDDSIANGLEEAVYSGLPAGTYVLDVAECSYLGSSCREPVFGTNTNITITVTQQ